MLRLGPRPPYWARVLRGPIVSVGGPLYFFVGLIIFLRDEFGLGSIRVVDLLSRWPWSVWVAVGLAILLAAALEGAYREHRSLSATTDAEIARLRSRLQPDVKIEIFPDPLLLVEGYLESRWGSEQKRYIICNSVYLSSAQEQSTAVDIGMLIFKKSGDKDGMLIPARRQPLPEWENYKDRPAYLPPMPLLPLPLDLAPRGAKDGYVAFEVSPFSIGLFIDIGSSVVWFRVVVMRPRSGVLDKSVEMGISLADLTAQNREEEPKRMGDVVRHLEKSKNQDAQ